MAGQEHEHIEFLRSQPQFLTVQGHGSLVKIDPEVTEFDHPVKDALSSAVARWGSLSQVLVSSCRNLQLLVI